MAAAHNGARRLRQTKERIDKGFSTIQGVAEQIANLKIRSPNRACFGAVTNRSHGDRG